MTEKQAREMLVAAYGPREEVDTSCFGDCCLRGEEKEALITLIYGAIR